MKKGLLLYLFFALTALISCAEDSRDSNYYITQEPNNSRIIGVWGLSGGSSFLSLETNDLQYVQFNQDGKAVIVYKDSITGILKNNSIIYAVLVNSTVTLDISSRSRDRGHVVTCLFDRPDSSTLTLTDSNNNTLTFTSEPEIPNSLLCKEFNIQNEYRYLEIGPDESTNLVYDGAGTYLWYRGYGSDDILYPFNITTGGLEIPSALYFSSTSYSRIHAYQASGPVGAGFWAHCQCGDTLDASLLNTTGTELVIVDTDSHIGHEISIDAIAWDGTNLWLSGRNSDPSQYELLKIQVDFTTPPPPAPAHSIVETYVFNQLNALTWDGTHFWCLSGYGSTISKIDPVEFKAVESYKLPDPDVEWRGLAVVGTDIYLLGYDYWRENKGVIFHVTTD